MRCYPIRSWKLTMIKIIIAWMGLHIRLGQRSKLTALNQNPDKQALAILIIHTGRMPVRTLMTIFTITAVSLMLRINLRSRKKRNMMKRKNTKAIRNILILIGKRNLHVLRLRGLNTKEGSSLNRNSSLNTKLQRREKWETNSKLWEASHRLTMFFGPGITSVIQTSRIRIK